MSCSKYPKNSICTSIWGPKTPPKSAQNLLKSSKKNLTEKDAKKTAKSAQNLSSKGVRQLTHGAHTYSFRRPYGKNSASKLASVIYLSIDLLLVALIISAGCSEGLVARRLQQA